MEKRWRCTVCGYIHRGDEPPEVCPVCGVGREKFVFLDEVETGPSLAKLGGLLREMIDAFMPHPVLAHFPNALVPTLLLFALLELVGLKSLDHGLYLLLALVLPAVVATLGSGIYSWRKHFDGVKSKIFHRKLFLGGCLVLIASEMLQLRYTHPALLADLDGVSLFFLLLVAAALCCVALLGHYGGMLVFGRIEKDHRHFD